MERHILHQTRAAQRFDGIGSPGEYDYSVGDRVMTIDGVPGRVVAIQDGPFRGNEEYEIELDDGLGGGHYTSSQILSKVSDTYYEASNLYTADKDYPELAEILRSRPDPAKFRFSASKKEGEEKDRDPDGDPSGGTTGPLSTTARLLIEAAVDPEFGFHIVSAWKDVVAKAKRIRSQGRVQITHSSDSIIVGNVEGDTSVYETGLQRVPGSRTAVSTYSCGCKWGAYHWGAEDDLSRFAGRMCSHALALQYEAQARGMFGKTIQEDDVKPGWVPSRVVVKYDIDSDKHIRARSSLSVSPIAVIVDIAKSQGHEDSLSMLGAVNDLFGNGPAVEPASDGNPLGATRPRDPYENPGSAGVASGPDPDDWGSIQQTNIFRDAAKDESQAEAELKDEPESALPEATAKNWEYEDPSALSPEMIDSNGTPTPESRGVVTSHPQSESESPTLQGSNTVDEIVEVLRESRSAVTKMALKNFTFQEQQELINEGIGRRARNFDKLDIEGTHYAYLEEEEDQVWLV